MNKSRKNAEVDARIISFYSRDTDRAPVKARDEYQHEMLEYFDVLEVAPADRELPLLSAYQQYRSSMGQEEYISSRQVLFAFTDVVPDSGSDGFTREEIKTFWECNSEPVLFTTLVNVENEGNLQELIQRIHSSYPEGKYLIYYTLDYCEVVIFLKGNSFHQCAELMFNLDYGTEPEMEDSSSALLVDSITLCSLVNGFVCKNQESLEKEDFGAYLRFGVADAGLMESFCDELKKLTKELSNVDLSKNWTLGRYDIGVFNPKANLKWVIEANKLTDKIKRISEAENSSDSIPWYTAHTCSILIKPNKIRYRGRISFHNADCQKLKRYMDRVRECFEATYTKTCKKLNIPADAVLLRWMREASTQAISFLGSNMMTDLGICLVPQFLDFFEYAWQLWNDDIVTNEQREQAEECFSTLFTNVSVLVDSMNHSSRQFIITPSFRTVAFEMPPKIMAYYIAVTHRLIDVFQDQDENLRYGFTISPKFARELDVRSLVLSEQMGGNQFLTIGIGEECLYRLQHTTVVLAHEISHFVGTSGRNRELRKTYIFMAELQSILMDLAEQLNKALVEYYNDLQKKTGAKMLEPIPPSGLVYVSWKSLKAEAQELLELLIACDESYQSKDTHIYAKEVLLLLQKIPYHLCNPALSDALFHFLWELLVIDFKGTTNLGRAMAQIELYYNNSNSRAQEEEKEKKKADDLPKPLEYSVNKRILSVFAKFHVRPIFLQILKDYAEQYGITSTGNPPRVKQTCDSFSEAYADLQAVLLFNLKWQAYCNLFRHPDRTLPEIVQPRLLAMRLALFSDQKRWQTEKDDEFSQAIRKIEALADTLQACGNNMEAWCKVLAAHAIDPSTVYYLVQYLTMCKKDIQAHFENSKEQVGELLDIYEELSDAHGARQLVSSMMKFIATYRKEIQDAM